MTAKRELIAVGRIAQSIHLVRGQKVMLDSDLAALYGVPTGHLNRAVKRNVGRFPSDFMFRVTAVEARILKCQIGISSWGGRRRYPYAFTEQSVAMLSSVLKRGRAWVAHASRVLVSASRRNSLPIARRYALRDLQSPRWRDAIANARDARATRR